MDTNLYTKRASNEYVDVATGEIVTYLELKRRHGIVATEDELRLADLFTRNHPYYEPWFTCDFCNYQGPFGHVVTYACYENPNGIYFHVCKFCKE